MTGRDVVEEIKRFVNATGAYAKESKLLARAMKEEELPEDEELELSEEGEVQKILNDINNEEMCELIEPIIRLALRVSIEARDLRKEVSDNDLQTVHLLESDNLNPVGLMG